MSEDPSPIPLPLTDQERAFLEAYRELDEADRVLLWCAMLTLLDQ